MELWRAGERTPTASRLRHQAASAKSLEVRSLPEASSLTAPSRAGETTGLAKRTRLRSLSLRRHDERALALVRRIPILSDEAPVEQNIVPYIASFGRIERSPR